MYLSLSDKCKVNYFCAVLTLYTNAYRHAQISCTQNTNFVCKNENGTPCCECTYYYLSYTIFIYTYTLQHRASSYTRLSYRREHMQAGTAYQCVLSFKLHEAQALYNAA